MDDHTTLLEREVAPEVPGRSPVDPLGQERALDAERLEGGHLLRLGREPRQAGMIKHIVEREQAPHQHFRGGDPAAAAVPGAERPVDPASVDSAHSTDAVDAGRILFDGYALRDEGADGAAHLFVVATQKARPLSPGPTSSSTSWPTRSGIPTAGPTTGRRSYPNAG